MSESGLVAAVKSTGRGPESFRAISGKLPFGARIVRRLRSIWPDKTDAELAARIRLSDRACREILASRARLSVEQLGELLVSEDGAEVLEAVMGDAKPKWWRRFKRQMAFAEVRRLQDEARAKLEALEREEI